MLPQPGLAPTLSSLLTTSTTAALSSATLLSVLNTTLSTTTSPKDAPNGECSLLGPFAILVQGALGCLALLALVYKRWRERPQRPVKIWFFDVSKQVVGSVLVHVANLVMSMLSSGQLSIKVVPETVVNGRGLMMGAEMVRRIVDGKGGYKPNPCSFYLLNLAIDTTIGIPILIFLLRILTALFALTPLGIPRESIQSGHYGTPPRTWWWFKQSIIYFIGLMGMKICVLIIFLLLPWISRIGDWALRWTEGDEALQVIFVMLIFPVIMNATQYYIIDSFIKENKPADHELLPEDDPDNVEGAYHEESSSIDEVHSGEDDDKELKAKVEDVTRKEATGGSGSGSSDSRPSSGRRKELLGKRHEYDPQFDGESGSPDTAGSSKGKDSETR